MAEQPSIITVSVLLWDNHNEQQNYIECFFVFTCSLCMQEDGEQIQQQYCNIDKQCHTFFPWRAWNSPEEALTLKLMTAIRTTTENIFPRTFSINEPWCLEMICKIYYVWCIHAPDYSNLIHQKVGLKILLHEVRANFKPPIIIFFSHAPWNVTEFRKVHNKKLYIDLCVIQ